MIYDSSTVSRARALWGPKVSAKNLRATFHFYHTAVKYHQHIGSWQDANATVQKYVAANKRIKSVLLHIFTLGREYRVTTSAYDF